MLQKGGSTETVRGQECRGCVLSRAWPKIRWAPGASSQEILRNTTERGPPSPDDLQVHHLKPTGPLQDMGHGGVTGTTLNYTHTGHLQLQVWQFTTITTSSGERQWGTYLQHSTPTSLGNLCWQDMASSLHFCSWEQTTMSEGLGDFSPVSFNCSFFCFPLTGSWDGAAQSPHSSRHHKQNHRLSTLKQLSKVQAKPPPEGNLINHT